MGARTSRGMLGLVAYDPRLSGTSGGCRLRPLSSRGMSGVDRVRERRRAAALARPLPRSGGSLIKEIARRLGRAVATVKAYLYDPTGEKARTLKARYGGCARLRGLHAGRNAKGDAYTFLGLPSRHDPGALDLRARAGSDATGGPATGWLTSTSAMPIRVRRRTSTSGSLLQVVEAVSQR